MNKEYIEREALLEEIKIKANTLHNFRSLYTDQSARVLDGLVEDIAKIPTADVAPVKHGEWLDTDTFDFHCIHIYQCSNCRREVADDYISCHKFCLHCGAIMDGGNK